MISCSSISSFSGFLSNINQAMKEKITSTSYNELIKEFIDISFQEVRFHKPQDSQRAGLGGGEKVHKSSVNKPERPYKAI